MLIQNVSSNIHTTTPLFFSYISRYVIQINLCFPKKNKKKKTKIALVLDDVYSTSCVLVKHKLWLLQQPTFTSAFAFQSSLFNQS